MRLQKLDLNYLETLEILLLERNTTRVSRRLNRTQPAISNALAKLREHFDDELLVRRGREMQPTPFALQILGPLQDTLRQLHGIAAARPNFNPLLSTRAYKIVASDYIATVLIGDLIVRVANLAPTVTIEQLPLTDESIGKFAQGEADALISPDNVTAGEFPKRVLFTENFVCIAGTDNHTVGASLTDEELFQQRRVVPPYKPYLPEAHYNEACGRPPIVLPFSSIPWFVAKSDYVAIIPERLVKMYEERLPLRRVRLEDPMRPVTFLAQHHSSGSGDAFKQWMLEQMSAVADPSHAGISEENGASTETKNRNNSEWPYLPHRSVTN